jgi:cytochrome P450
MTDQVEQRRRNPGADLISRLVMSDVSKAMSDDTLIANCLMLIVAGSETTAKLLSKAIYTLAILPHERRKLHDDIGLLPRFLEETQRWDPVVQLENRYVNEDAEIEGQPVARGQQLALLIGAANRDPARYRDPTEFNLLREPINHLGFGFGMHLCLGIALARIETRIAVEAFLRRFPDYEVTNEVVYRLFYARGPDRLCISLQ